MKQFIFSILIAGFLMLGTVFAVPFTLRNGSMKSIPLKIPGVMNPNLSPMSNSGVDLAVGQKVFFRHKGRKYLLFVVDESFRGKRVMVNRVMAQRKKELGLK